MQNSASLTRFPPGSLRELAAITASLTLVLISSNLMGFIDRLILASYSLQSLEACVAAVNLGSSFQMPLVRIAAMTQAFIGQYQGSGRFALMGGCVWQMVWFSILTMALTLPIGWWIGPSFFAGTAIAQEGLSYFQCLMGANFLFPLGAALMSFYLGRGHTKLVLIATVASQLINVLLDFLFIFGIQGLLLPMGALGAALATAISQLAFCIFLFWDFCKNRHQEIYGTGEWRLRWSVLKESLSVGIPRTISSTALLTAWALVTHIMLCRGGDHLSVLAFGGSLVLLFMCFLNSLTQGVMTTGAYVIGTKSWDLIWKLYQSAFFLVGIGAALLAIPCLLYPEWLIALFFKGSITAELAGLLQRSCCWLWLYFILYGLLAAGSGLLYAYGDTKFIMVFNLTIGWLLCYLPVFAGIEIWQWSADKFWLVSAGGSLITAAAYFARLRQERWKMAADHLTS